VGTAVAGKTGHSGDHRPGAVKTISGHVSLPHFGPLNALMQTANIRLADGSGHVIPNMPWTALKVLDKK
jgi:hypothetical protein